MQSGLISTFTYLVFFHFCNQCLCLSSHSSIWTERWMMKTLYDMKITDTLTELWHQTRQHSNGNFHSLLYQFLQKTPSDLDCTFWLHLHQKRNTITKSYSTYLYTCMSDDTYIQYHYHSLGNVATVLRSSSPPILHRTNNWRKRLH